MEEAHKSYTQKLMGGEAEVFLKANQNFTKAFRDKACSCLVEFIRPIRGQVRDSDDDGQFEMEVKKLTHNDKIDTH